MTTQATDTVERGEASAIEEIARAEVVSFDLFDTLSMRLVDKPEDVFAILGGAPFRKARARAEFMARRKHPRREITLDEIYRLLPAQYRHLEEVEKKLEVALCAPRAEGMSLYRAAVRLGKRILITTDMYLPHATIEQILAKIGVEVVPLTESNVGRAHLYLSSDTGNRKVDGALFSQILADENIRARDLVHIGDNETSDGDAPRRMGIRSVLIGDSHHVSSTAVKAQKVKEYALPASRAAVSQTIFDTFMEQQHEKNAESDISPAGFEILGPLLYGYVSWLDRQFAENNYDTVLFFSREGHLIKEAYERVRSRSNPKRMYFLASRRALQVPAMSYDFSFEKVMDSMFIPYTTTRRWIVEHWGLDENTTPDAWQKAEETVTGLEMSLDDMITRDEAKSAGMRRLFDILSDDILANARRELDGFQAYVNALDLSGRIAIVDIGWNGNMQRAFSALMREVVPECTIEGYYLGVFPGPNSQTQIMHSYLGAANRKKPSQAPDDVATRNAAYVKDLYCHSVLELYFMAMHGSASHYIVPEEISEENREDINLSGEDRFVVLEPFEYADTDTRASVEAIQTAAFRFIDQYKEIGLFLVDNGFYERNALRPFYRLGYTYSPHNDMLAENGDLTIIDDDQRIPVACPRKISHYVFHPRDFTKDIMVSSWKTGFLKRLVKLPLPYVRLLKAARRRMEK